MRLRVPLTCHLMLTDPSLPQVCSWSESRLSVSTPTLVVLQRTNYGDACREILARKVGKLGGEIKF